MFERKIDALHYGLLLVFSGLIFCCARGDLWFDEIWSINAAESASSALDILARFRHDNNHPLNTLYLYLVGESRHPLSYRLMAIASGIGSVFLAGLIGRQRNRVEGLIALVLFGTSYPLLLYFSEARGYSTAIFLALVGYYMLISGAGEFGFRRRCIFWFVVALGLLAHATFVMPLFGFVVLSFEYHRSRSAYISIALVKVVQDYWFPAVLFVLYYLYFLRHVAIGSGPVFSYYHQFSTATAYLLGLPDHPFARLFAVGVFLALVFAGTKLLRESNSMQWTFFPAVIVISPLLLILYTKPDYFYFRYILLPFPFFYLLLAFILAYLFSSLRNSGKPIAVLILMAFVAGQWVHIGPLLKYQRGNYIDLLQTMVERSSGSALFVASDYDFRNGMLVNYYKKFIDGGSEIVYVSHGFRSDLQPRWFITHHLDPDHVAPAAIKVTELGRFNIIASYLSSGDSGWNWYLYESAD